jgi:hypothetical protein
LIISPSVPDLGIRNRIHPDVVFAVPAECSPNVLSLGVWPGNTRRYLAAATFMASANFDSFWSIWFSSSGEAEKLRAFFVT